MIPAIVIDGFGDPEAAHLTEIALPVIGPGDVLVRMAAAGINPADWKCCAGRLSAFPSFQPHFPFVPGFDGSGIVEDVGAAVKGIARGDRVFVRSNQMLGRDGTFAGFVAVSADGIAPMPPGIDLIDAATVPTAGVTGWQCLMELGAPGEGDQVFVHGGASATGAFVIQFARARGARIAASCSAANRDYVLSLGAEAAIDYRAENVCEAVRAWAPHGVTRLVDAVGLGTLPQAALLVRSGGSMAQIATLDPMDAGPDVAAGLARGVRVISFSAIRAKASADMISIGALMAAGTVKASRTELVDMAEIPAALGRLMRGEASRKLVAVVDPALVGQGRAQGPGLSLR